MLFRQIIQNYIMVVLLYNAPKYQSYYIIQ